MNKFANRLKECLQEKNITQLELAKKLNTTQPTINRWVNGIQEPNFNMLILIAKELGETLDYLLGLED